MGWISVRKICIIAEDYPSEGKPNFPFVQQLAFCLSNEKFECVIIAPQSVSKCLVRCEKPNKLLSFDKNPEGKQIKVYRPLTITFSNATSKWLNKLSCLFYEHAIARTLRKLKDIETVYCYFWHVGLIAAHVLQNSKVQLVIQASECSISVTEPYLRQDILQRVNGVVCASRKNYEESIEHGLIVSDCRTAIIPNGFREDEFYVMDQLQAREKLGFDPSAFIVAFVGDFNERKGSQRLSSAIDRFPDVYSIFIGNGNEPPMCRNILFQGTVEHNRLCTYLNSADVFVLPTNAEGCCNAIIEAIACGLPVVSSNKSFNNEILDEEDSIRIHEDSVDEIAEAIRLLKDDRDLRQRMSEHAVEVSSKFRIKRRAQSIASFILGEDPDPDLRRNDN